MKDKLQNLWFKLRGYWKTPPKGYEVSYKEATHLIVGNMGNGLRGVFTTWAGMAVSIPLMVSYFQVSTGALFVLGFIGTLSVFIKRPFLSMIIDNSKSVNGKFRRLLIWPTVVSVLLLTLIPFIPQVWVMTNICTIPIPAIPVMGIYEQSNVTISLGVLIAYLLNDIASFVGEFPSQGMTGLMNTVTSVSQERSIIASANSLVSAWPSTLMSVAIPFMASWFFSGGTGNVLIYRIVFPICAIGTILLISVAYKGTHERIVVGKKFEAKVKFGTGAKALCKNKYFWLLWIHDIFKNISIGANFSLWVCYYAIGGATGDTVLAVCNMVLGLGCGLGIFLGPYLAKRFGSVKVYNLSSAFYVLTLATQLFCVRSPYLLLVCFFLQNTFNGFSFFADIIKSQALDYEQYRSGLRLDGFWTNFSGLLTTPVGIFTGMLSPLFLSMAGVGFGDPIDVSFSNTEIMYKAFFFTTLLALLGAILRIVPMLFFNLNEKKHADVVRALRVRASCTNYLSGDLTDEDIIQMKQIWDYIHAPENEKKITGYLKEELKKHNEYEQIIIGYVDAQKRKEEQSKQEEYQNFLRDCEAEEKKYQFKKAKDKEKSLKKNTTFDEEVYRKEYIMQSKFLRKLSIEEQQRITTEVCLTLEKEKEVVATKTKTKKD